MLEKAIEKIKSELDQNKSNSYVQVVGTLLMQHLESNPGAADKILVAEKSIAKSLDEMKKVAEKKKIGNCAVLTDQEGFAVVLKYFDISSKGLKKKENIVSEPFSKPDAGNDFDVKLEDLL